MNIPVIETERLILRPLTINDAQAVFEWAGDERVAKYMIYPRHADLSVTRTWLESVQKLENQYSWGFELKEEHRLIGSGSIKFCPEEDCWSFGYNIRYDCWNNGYTTEACKRMIEFVRVKHGAKSFCSEHAVENPASGRVMEKCGLTFDSYGKYSKLDGSGTFKSKKYKMILE